MCRNNTRHDNLAGKIQEGAFGQRSLCQKIWLMNKNTPRDEPSIIRESMPTVFASSQDVNGLLRATKHQLSTQNAAAGLQLSTALSTLLKVVSRSGCGAGTNSGSKSNIRVQHQVHAPPEKVQEGRKNGRMDTPTAARRLRCSLKPMMCTPRASLHKPTSVVAQAGGGKRKGVVHTAPQYVCTVFRYRLLLATSALTTNSALHCKIKTICRTSNRHHEHVLRKNSLCRLRATVTEPNS